MQLSPDMTNAIGAALAAAVIYGIGYLVQLLKTKTKNEKVDGAINAAGALAQTLVLEGFQTVADDVAAAYADGKMTKEEKAGILLKLKTDQLAKFKKLYGEYWPKVLGFGEEQLTTFLSAHLEAAVSSGKPTPASQASTDVAAGKLPAFLAGAPPA